MDVDNNPIITIITGAVVGFLGAIFIIGILKFREKLWRVKHFIRTILYKIYPSAFSQNAVHSEIVIINSKVNNQSVVIIENLPKCTTAKDLVKCLGLKEFVVSKKLMKLSVAADRKGQCAGLAVAVCPRYSLQHSGILNKNNSDYGGNVIKVKEVQNRKISLKKQVNWLSSENWSHVGMRGRFQSYDDILHSITTQHGYYLIDGGNYVQYTERVADVIEAAAASGICKMVMKMKNPGQILDAEVGWCKAYPGFLYMTAGIWNNFVDSYVEDPAVWFTALGFQLEDPINSKFIVAIGECGTSQSLRIQDEKNLFTAMVKLAEIHKKPILCKCTYLVDHMLEILEQHPEVQACLNIGYEIPASGSVSKWIKKGYYLGISAGLWTLKKNTNSILEELKTAPLDKLILQSNAPYIKCDIREMDYIAEIENTTDFKGVRQESIDLFKKDRDSDLKFEPCDLMVVVELLASCLNKSPIMLTALLNANAEKFYKFNCL